MKKHVRRVILDIFGCLFVVLGLIGLFLPVLQGVLFLLIGLYLISLNSTSLEAHLERILKKHPKFSNIFETADSYLKIFLKKIGLHE